MTGKILTKAQVDNLGLEPTGQTFGRYPEAVWKYYQAPTFLAILKELKGGRFRIMACCPEEVKLCL